VNDGAASLVIHATAVAIGGHGVLLCGPSACGKSDLALRLIDAGAHLVADDRVVCTARAGGLWLSAPPTIAGLMEVRGVGLVRLPCVVAQARLVVDGAAQPARLPAPDHRVIAQRSLPMVAMALLEPSAPAKVRAALALALTAKLWQDGCDE